MRRFLPAAALTLVALIPAFLAPATWAPAARADQSDPRLPPLFERLARAPDRAAAQPVEAEIWSLWGQSGDDGSQRAFDAGVTAMGRRAYPEAIDAFTTVIRQSPRFAEGWNKRATVYYLAGDYARAVADIRQTLALEPRHFGALSGLGLIYVMIGEPGPAIRSFKAALAIDPQLEGAEAHIKMLEEENGGSPT